MNVVLGLLGFMALVMAIGFFVQYLDERGEQRKATEEAIKKAQDERNRRAREAYEANRRPAREAPVTVPIKSNPVTGSWRVSEPAPHQPDILLTAIVVDSFSEPSYTAPSRTENYSTPSYSSCDYGSSSSSSSSYDSGSSSCDSSSSSSSSD